MRKLVAIVFLLVTIAAMVGRTSRPGRVRATFTPQVPTANRAVGNRVFLERAEVLFKEMPDSFMVVTGNVKFTKGPMIMTCDSAHYFPGSESFEAYGNVKMQQGDTLFVYADELNYDGPEEVCYLYADAGKKVRLINRDVKLETDVFVYDLRSDVGYYTVGGVLTDKNNRLTSLQGEYVPSTKEASFYVDVHLNSESSNDTLNIWSDTLYYNTNSHIAELFSPSRIVNARGTIFTTDGLYHTQLDTAALYNRSEVVTPTGRRMIADTMYYDRTGGVGRCYGNVFLLDSARQATLTADYGFFNQSTDSAYAVGNLLIKEYSKGDTLYLHGHQLNAYRVFDSVKVAAIPADTLTGAPAVPESMRVDTNNVADIYPRVRFYRSDFQGICDSMRVSRADTMLQMYVAPVIWNEGRQIYGDVIELMMNDSTIRQARLPQQAFTLSKVYGDFYDQLSGKEMVAHFIAGELHQLDINGNVEILMYPEEADSTFNKMVTAQSSFLTATFKGNNTEMIKMWPETTGQATPLYLVRRSMLYLPKFKLFEGMRPLSPSDVMTIPPAMEALMSTAERPKVEKEKATIRRNHR